MKQAKKSSKFMKRLFLLLVIVAIGAVIATIGFISFLHDDRLFIIGNWNVTPEYVGNVPTPFDYNAFEFIFYFNGSVLVIDSSQETTWFNYSVYPIQPLNDMNGDIVFSDSTGNWTFRYSSSNGVMIFNAMSPEPPYIFELIRAW